MFAPLEFKDIKWVVELPQFGENVSRENDQIPAGKIFDNWFSPTGNYDSDAAANVLYAHSAVIIKIPPSPRQVHSIVTKVNPVTAKTNHDQQSEDFSLHVRLLGLKKSPFLSRQEEEEDYETRRLPQVQAFDELRSLRKHQLQALLRAFGGRVSGNKEALLDRLVELIRKQGSTKMDSERAKITAMEDDPNPPVQQVLHAAQASQSQQVQRSGAQSKGVIRKAEEPPLSMQVPEHLRSLEEAHATMNNPVKKFKTSTGISAQTFAGLPNHLSMAAHALAHAQTHAQQPQTIQDFPPAIQQQQRSAPELALRKMFAETQDAISKWTSTFMPDENMTDSSTSTAASALKKADSSAAAAASALTMTSLNKIPMPSRSSSSSSSSSSSFILQQAYLQQQQQLINAQMFQSRSC